MRTLPHGTVTFLFADVEGSTALVQSTGSDYGSILATMRRLLDQGDLIRASDENAALHRRVLELGGHAIAQRLIATLNSQLVRFQFRTILVPGRPERSFAEHTAIVEALEAGDPDRAEAAVRQHLSHVAQILSASHQ